VTPDAKTGGSTGFFGVARSETGSVQTVEAHGVERQPRRQSWNVHAVARRARAFRVARSAKVTRGSRAHAVLADPIAVVHEVARGQCILCLHVDMATVAVAHCPLVFVLMTSEARRHLRAECFGTFEADLDVAPHAISLCRGHVRPMIEPKMLARHLGAGSYKVLSVTIVAVASIVRLGVTLEAVLRPRKVNPVIILRAHHARMTGQAIDALAHVRAVFERMSRCFANPEHAGASA
jgi:hypothetical protein